MAEERKDVEQEQKKSVGNIGLPFVVLVKNGGARISTADESLDYLDFENAESNAKSLYEN